MKVRDFFPCAIYLVVVSLSLLFSACGPDKAAPTDPATTSTIPDIVFFNTFDPSAAVLFEGRATDNTRVETVLISFDNGAFWHTAEIDNTSPNTLWNVEWSYLADETDIPAVMNTLLIKASDADANEVISSPIPLQKKSGPGVSDLEGLFSGATDGQIIALSSGIGGAYGNGAIALTIPINVGLTVLGSGYGSTATSGGVTFPAVASTATILQSPVSSASIFSVDADLSLKNLRLLGAENAVSLSDTGSDPQLRIEDCVFDQQGAWAIFAEDNDSGVGVEFLSSAVDTSQADSSRRGGLLLDNVAYQVEESGFFYHTDPGGPADGTVQGAAIQVIDGAGEIAGSIFEDNALAIWASGGSPVITSCDISGAAFTTNGINLTGGPGSALIRRNTIDGNTGYGLRVGGEMELTLRNNAITSNGLSGVLIDSELGNTNINKINMGESTDKGRNLFDGNFHPNGEGGWDTQVFVTLGTQEGSNMIPTNWNYWGSMVSTSLDVNRVIIDGNDNPARATLAIGSIYFDISEVGP